VSLQSSTEVLSNGTFVCSKGAAEFALHEHERIFEWQAPKR